MIMSWTNTKTSFQTTDVSSFFDAVQTSVFLPDGRGRADRTAAFTVRAQGGALGCVVRVLQLSHQLASLRLQLN